MLVDQIKAKHILTIVLIHLSLNCGAQQKFDFNFKEVGLETAIKELSHQSKLNILYNPNILNGDIKITGNLKNLTLFTKAKKKRLPSRK